jgi:putative NADH-flavin reductase
MKLTIFGASGRTGKQLVEQALAAGNEVVAFVRNPSNLDISHQHLRIDSGELADKDAIDRAVQGADAVLSALGPKMPGPEKNKPITLGIQNILAAMTKHNVQRLVLSWGPSLIDPSDRLGFKFKTLNALVKLLARPAFDESMGVTEVLRMSDRDWTIVRVIMPTNNPKPGKMRIGFLGDKKVEAKISRADLAAFMLNQIEDKTYLRKAPVLSN